VIVAKAPTKTSAEPIPYNARTSRKTFTLLAPKLSACKPSTYPKGASPWIRKPGIIGRRVPILSSTLPAGVLQTSLVNRFIERMIPTRNGEIPRTGPSRGSVGKGDSATQPAEENP
jgi:hypothetical protein